MRQFAVSLTLMQRFLYRAGSKVSQGENIPKAALQYEKLSMYNSRLLSVD
jgi:hypothetical protein